MSVDRQSQEWWPDKIPRPLPKRPREQLHKWEWVKFLLTEAIDGMPPAFELIERFTVFQGAAGRGAEFAISTQKPGR